MWRFKNRFLRILDALLSEFEDDDRVLAEFRALLTYRLSPERFNAVMGLIECKNYKEMVAWLAEQEDGRRISVEGVRKRATRGLKQIRELFDEFRREQYGE